jgi:hypothetical protein
LESKPSEESAEAGRKHPEDEGSVFSDTSKLHSIMVQKTILFNEITLFSVT